MKSLADLLKAQPPTALAPAASTARRVLRRAAPAAPGLQREHPLLQRIYAARGVIEADALRVSLDRLLPVSSLTGVEAAAALLARHRTARILVIGDFDADGATSTALVLRALRAWGFTDTGFLVPDRFRFGYGLTPGIVDLAATQFPALIVTVDNGISSVEGVARARALGIAVLVTDHHLAGAQLPAADVIVNPNLPGAQFGSPALAGVGVAFYVMAAVRRHLLTAGLLPDGAAGIAEFLDLVALGTVADLVPLDANNRVLVAQGLRRIREGRCVPGITALLQIANRASAQITATDLGFAVAPRLNAAGRLDDMSIGIECLLAATAEDAQARAVQLDALNQERRRIEADMQALALTAVKGIDLPQRGPRRNGLCIYDPTWHQGVVGLVASRVKDRVRRPVIAFARAGDELTLRGSARSVPGVHVRDVLQAVATAEPQLIHRFGGHAMAAGLTIAEADLDRFARAFEAQVALALRGAAADDAIETDGALDDALIALSTAELLRAAGPWGQGFPEPSFDGEFEVLRSRVVGERHVKLQLRPVGSRAAFDAIAFNFLDEEVRVAPAGRVQAVYRLDINEYRGERRLQLLIDYLLPLP